MFVLYVGGKWTMKLDQNITVETIEMTRDEFTEKCRIIMIETFDLEREYWSHLFHPFRAVLEDGDDLVVFRKGLSIILNILTTEAIHADVDHYGGDVQGALEILDIADDVLTPEVEVYSFPEIASVMSYLQSPKKCLFI